MKDRRYAGSSRILSPPRRRNEFSPPSRGRIGEFAHSSPRRSSLDVHEERREAKYCSRDDYRRDDYRRPEDRHHDYERADRYYERNCSRGGGNQDWSLSRGGMRPSGDAAAGGRYKDREDVDYSRKIYQTYGSDGDRDRNGSHGGIRSSGDAAAGGRFKDRDTEGDYSRKIYQSYGNDGDRDRNGSHGGMRSFGDAAAGGRFKDRDIEGDYSRKIYQSYGSDGDRDRNGSHKGMRSSGDDAAGGRFKDKDREGDYSRKIYQSYGSDGDRDRNGSHGGMRSFGDAAAGGRFKDRDTEDDYSRKIYQSYGNDGDRDRNGSHGGMRSFGDAAAGGRFKERDIEGDYSSKIYQSYGSDGDRDRNGSHKGMRSYGDHAAGGRFKDRDTEGDYLRKIYQSYGGDGDRDRNGSREGMRLSGYDALGSRDRDSPLDGDHLRRMYKASDYGEDSRRRDKYGGLTTSFQWDDQRNSDISKGNIDHEHACSGARNELECGFYTSKFVDEKSAGYGLDTNLISSKADRDRVSSSSFYQMDMGAPLKSASQGVAVASDFSQSLGNSLHKYEDIEFTDKNVDQFISKRLVPDVPVYMTKDPYRSDTSCPSVRADIDMIMPSSRPRPFDTNSPGSAKTNIISSSRDFLPFGEVKSTSEMFNYSNSCNEYITKSQAKSSADHDGWSGGLQNEPLYLDSTKEGRRDFVYPSQGQSDRVGMNAKSTEIYGKVGDVGEDNYAPYDGSRMGTVEPFSGKVEGSSYEGYLRGKRILEPLSMSLGQTPDHYDSHKSLETTRHDLDIRYYGSPRSSRGMELHHDHGTLRFGELNNDHQVADTTWSAYKQADGLPPRLHDSFLDDFDHGQRNEFILDNEELLKSSKMTFKRRHDTEYGGAMSDLGDAIEPWRDDVDCSFISKKLRVNNSNYGKTERVSNSIARHHFSAIDSEILPSHSKNISGNRDIKKRLGPLPRKVPLSQRLAKKNRAPLKKRLSPGAQKKDLSRPPWLRNRKASNSRIVQIASDECQTGQLEGSQEDNVTQEKLEPPENSENFKQMVSSAFFKFVKQLNETPAKRKKYTQDVIAGSLKCIVCGSASEEFGDTESLVLHAFTSQRVGVRSLHLGLHKALCALMGWKSAQPYDTTWACESLCNVEHLSIREDLILWPPVVIVHNNSIGDQNEGQQVIVSVEELEDKLTDMGFGQKMKVFRGKAANQSVMVVQFGATFSGLQEAERLHKVYLITKHGREELKRVKAGNGTGDNAKTEASSASRPEEVLYGYMGIAEDLHILDFEIKKRCVIKSKRDIQDIADARLKD